VLLTHCGQLILRKISTFDATRCQILRLKCTKFDFRWGSAPDALGSLQRSPDPLTVFKGPTTKGRASRRKRGRGVMERGRKREGKRRGSEGKKRWRGQPPIFWPGTTLYVQRLF